MRWTRPDPDEHEPAWRVPFVLAGRADPEHAIPLGLDFGETVLLRRKAQWHGERLPVAGEHLNLLALHTDREVTPGLIRFNLTVDAVEWGVVFSSPPAHVPMFTFAPVEGDAIALQWLLDAGWQPEALGNDVS